MDDKKISGLIEQIKPGNIISADILRNIFTELLSRIQKLEDK